MSNIKDLTGQTFGLWTVTGQLERVGLYNYVRCCCACGKEKLVCTKSLLRGNSLSCGCVRDAATAKRNAKHDYLVGHHTKQPPKTYNCWRNMKARCNNPNNHKFPNYGGRGIKVCDTWNTSFAAFLADLGECPGPEYSIDRIDNDGDYEPGNCRWATAVEQTNNQSRNTRLTLNGRTQTLAEWARETGIHRTTILQRINRCKWSVERALTEPVHFGRH